MSRGILLGGALPEAALRPPVGGPTRRYGMYSPTTREFLSYRGRCLVHWCPHELAFLFEGAHQVREVPPSIGPEFRLEVAMHPGMSNVRFPQPGVALDRTQFRRTTT